MSNNSKLNLFLRNINKYKTDTFIDGENYKKIIKNISSDDFDYKNIRVSGQFVNDLLKFCFSEENSSESFIKKFDLSSKKEFFKKMQKMKWNPNISENDVADSNDNWSEQKINFLDNLSEVANDKISIDITGLDKQKLKKQFLFAFLKKNNQNIFKNHWPSDLKKINNEKTIGDLLEYLASLKNELDTSRIEKIDSNFRSIKKLNNFTWNNLKNKSEFIRQSQDLDNIKSIIVEERFENKINNFIIDNFSAIKNKDILYEYLDTSILRVEDQITKNILLGLTDSDFEKIINGLKINGEDDFDVYIKLINQVNIPLRNAADFKKMINERIYNNIENKQLNMKKNNILASIHHFNNKEKNLYAAFQRQYGWQEGVSYEGEEWVSTSMPISEITNGNFYAQYKVFHEGDASKELNIKISPEELLEVFEKSEVSVLKEIFESSANTIVYKTLIAISEYIRDGNACKNINFIDFQVQSEDGGTVKAKNEALFEKKVKESSWSDIEKQEIWNENWALKFKAIKEQYKEIKSKIKNIDPKWKYIEEGEEEKPTFSFNALNQLYSDKTEELNKLNKDIQTWVDPNHSEKNLSKKQEWMKKVEESMKEIKDGNAKKVNRVNKLIDILSKFEDGEYNKYTCDEIVGIEDPNLKKTEEWLESFENRIEEIAKSQEFKEGFDERNKSIVSLIKWFKENSPITNIDELQKAFKSQDDSEVIENYLSVQKNHIRFYKEKNNIIAKWSNELNGLAKNPSISFERINLNPSSLKELNVSKEQITNLENEAKKEQSSKENIKTKKK